MKIENNNNDNTSNLYNRTGADQRPAKIPYHTDSFEMLKECSYEIVCITKRVS